MRGRGVLAPILVVVSIGCVPGRLGVVSVGALLPPMPLETTPTPFLTESSATPVYTKTPQFTPTPTPTPTPASPATGEPEYLPSEPDTP